MQERLTPTEASPYSALSAKSLLGSYWSTSRSWRSVVYPEKQCGFRAERSTVFSNRQLQESEQQMPLHIAFIDLTNAFDLFNRDGLLGSPKVRLPTDRAECLPLILRQHTTLLCLSALRRDLVLPCRVTDS